MGNTKPTYTPNTLVKCNSTESRYERYPSMISNLDYYIPNHTNFKLKFKMSKIKDKKGTINIHKVFLIPVPKKELLDGLHLQNLLRNIDTELGVGVSQNGDLYVISNNVYNQSIKNTLKNSVCKIERKNGVLTLNIGTNKTPLIEKHQTASFNYMVAISFYNQDSFYDKSVSLDGKDVIFLLNDDAYIES